MFFILVFGSFFVLVGLLFKVGVCVIVFGVFVGICIFVLMSLFGLCNGISDLVLFGVYFGIYGWIVGLFFVLFMLIVFFLFVVWSLGDVFVGGVYNLVGVLVNGFMFGVVYLVFVVFVLIVCIYGFCFMLWVNKIVVWVVSVLFVVGLFVFVGLFDMCYVGML